MLEDEPHCDTHECISLEQEAMRNETIIGDILLLDTAQESEKQNMRQQGRDEIDLTHGMA